MDPLAAIKVTFFQECEEQLAELESGLLVMQDGAHDDEMINALFRAVHSIKGGAGTFGLEALVRFAHVFETVLDEMRSGKLPVDANVVAIMLRAADMLADHVRAARDDGSADEERSRAIAGELANLCGISADGPEETVEEIEGLDFVPVAFAFDDAPPPAPLPEPVMDLPEPEPEGPPRETWTIIFKPRAALYASGNETAFLLRELQRLGDMDVTVQASGLPLLQDMDPEEGYLVWTVTLQTAAEETAIREVFEFVDGDCDIEVKSARADASAALDVHALIAMATAASGPAAEAPAMAMPAPAPAIAPAAPEADNSDLMEIIKFIDDAKAAVAADEKGEPLAPPPSSDAGIPAAKAQAAAGGAAAAQAGSGGQPPAGQTIRVDLERVDRLIDLVGELVINQAMLAQRVAECGLARSSSVAIGLDDLEHLTREIQDSVMAIRAQPVKSVFQRMPRLVREVAAMVGKQVRLVTEGEGTEVDKTVIERLTDPITHMIRNAIDHGLEKTEDRIARGKPAEGTVRLAALHRSGRIVIEVSDDGAGINRERVKNSAISKGLIPASADLSDEEIDNLIFMPGFSTAATVSDISGRGVGMDVVKRSIQALGGRITIASEPGKGSTFTLSLPLTLAVLDGMVVSVCGQTLVAPLTGVVETLQPKAGDVRSLGPNGTVIQIRETYLPLIDVGVQLGYRDAPLLPTSGVALLVEGEGGARAALLVDTIQGQRQVVIKSLEANYRKVPGIAGATILGDGRVALILDVDSVLSAKVTEPPRNPTVLAAAG